jgi:antitoxin VapB
MPLKTARVINDGGSQAVSLPAEFHFDGDKVFVRRDQRTGDVILSRKLGWSRWDEYFENRGAGETVPAEFMCDRPLNTPLIDKLTLFRYGGPTSSGISTAPSGAHSRPQRGPC